MSHFQKFENLYTTSKGEKRASVTLSNLETLWFNTGTQCNLSCENCYIESNPRNDRLSFLNKEDVRSYLDEIKDNQLSTKKIGFTGGEPFLNPHFIEILELTLSYDFKVLVLTNATNLTRKYHAKLLKLKDKYGDNLMMRISLDHYSQEVHEKERGINTFEKCLSEIKWFVDNGFNTFVAGRSLTGEDEQKSLIGYQELFNSFEIDLNLSENRIVIFPEMIATENVPEISVGCWDILKKTPEMQMCSKERMIVKRKGQEKPKVLACTLLAYDPQFELGETLMDAKKEVFLNHTYCAKFCVLGGSSCS